MRKSFLTKSMKIVFTFLQLFEKAFSKYNLSTEKVFPFPEFVCNYSQLLQN